MKKNEEEEEEERRRRRRRRRRRNNYMQLLQSLFLQVEKCLVTWNHFLPLLPILCSISLSPDVFKFSILFKC
jgi:hypothetical protein